MGMPLPFSPRRDVVDQPTQRVISIGADGRVATLITAGELAQALAQGGDVRVCQAQPNGSMFTVRKVRAGEVT